MFREGLCPSLFGFCGIECVGWVACARLYDEQNPTGGRFATRPTADLSKADQLNVSELARLCDLSRTTAYKYIGLVE